MKILLDNETGDNIPADLLRLVIEETAGSEQLPPDLEVSLLLTDDDGIRRLNRRFRHIDKATDVLSFPQMEKKDLLAASPGSLLGDIVISVEKAHAQAEEYGHSMERELCFLTAHGMLHLMGYDHETALDEADMIKKQKILLGKVGL